MGLMDLIKNELVEVIHWTDETRDTLVHKFPSAGARIKYGAQLTVRESQAAIFINEGKIADVFAPGRFTLTTENMPVLSRLKGWMHGFQSPFLVDVYFVSTRQFAGMKWGTPNPIILRDPELKQVRVRAFGSYCIRITDPATFLREQAGTKSTLNLGDIEPALRSMVSARFADALAEMGVSVYDLARNYTELGDRLRPLLQRDLLPSGLDLVQFLVENASVPPEVEAMLDKTTQMNMVGDMNRYAQFEAANNIKTFAERSDGGVAGASAEMAIGAMMAKNLAPSITPPGPPPLPHAAQPMSRAEIMSTLKELGELKQAGILTEDEFQKKKLELLARL